MNSFLNTVFDIVETILRTYFYTLMVIMIVLVFFLPFFFVVSAFNSYLGGKNESKIISPLSVVTPTTTPSPTHTPSKKAIASWYCEGFEGKRTASGKIYDCDKLTAANNELPFGTIVRITGGSRGNSVEVTINDRGGFKKYGRTFDLSKRAFQHLAPLSVGILEVEWEIIKS